MEIKRKMSVQSVFGRFLIWFCALLAGLVFLFLLLAFVLDSTVGILPANYWENMLEENRTKIEEAEKVTEDLIPEPCSYGVYQTDGTFLYGSLAEENRQSVWQAYVQGNKESRQADGYLKFFPRNREVCIAVYHVRSEFGDPVLRKRLPGAPEKSILLFFIFFLIGSVILVRRFGRAMKEELEKLKMVTEKVRLGDLDFEKPDSKIREVDEVMDSMTKMKEALETSLKQQWSMEENRRQQVRALVHDIKTPLTVIRGNAQLLGESESLEESREYETYILQETDHIEQYIQVLQEMLKTEGILHPKREKVEIRKLSDEFAGRARTMASAKKQQLEVVISLQSDYIMNDRQLLQRVWENLLNNAVEYTPEGGNISIHITEEKDRLHFQIEDDGPGFTEEDLRHGMEQFYQGDKSRSSRKHYGMGLFIVQSFVSSQGGRMTLSNSPELKGACVHVELTKIQESEE